MYWSVYETLLLVTGILSAAIALLPQKGIEPRTRILAVVIGLALVILAFVLGNVSTFTYPSVVMIAPALPVLAGVMIVLDARKRVARSVAVGGFPSPAGWAPPAGAAPFAEQPQGFAPHPGVAPSTAAQAQAADPATAPETLAELAQIAPDARPFIAENPAAYPGLLEWLGQLQDPGVNAALARRAVREAGIAQGAPLPNQAQPSAGQPFALPSGRTSTVFLGLSRRELVLDTLALLLLVVALFSSAQMNGPWAIRLLGVVVTIVSLASLALGYLARGGLVRLPATKLSAYRVYANLPFFAFTLIVLVTDVVSAFGLSVVGLGFMVMFGLAGAVLAASPRESDVADGAPGATKLSWVGLSVLSITIVVLALLRFLVAVVAWLVNLHYGGATYLIFASFTLLLQLATIVPIVALLLFRRSEAARIVLLVFGASSVLWALLFGLRGFAGESLAIAGVFATLLPAIAALALTPAISRSTRPAQGVLGSPVALSFLGIAVVALFPVVFNATVLLSQMVSGGFWVSLILVAVLIAAVAVVAVTPVVRASANERLLSLIAAGVIVLLGIIYFGITFAQGGVPSVFDLLFCFGLPGAIILLKTVKKGALSLLSRPVVSVAEGAAAAPLARSTSGVVASVAPASPVASQHVPVEAPVVAVEVEGVSVSGAEAVVAAGAVAVAAQETVDRADILREASAAVPVESVEVAPVAAVPVEQPVEAPAEVPVEALEPVAPSHGFTVEQALDPNTDAATLYAIAIEAPELRVALARNPSTYPDLVGWLGALGDSAIDAALAAR